LDKAAQQAEELHADQEMAALLEEARLRMAAYKEHHYDWAEADAAYASAFEKYGLDVGRLDPQEVAKRIRERSIQSQLVAALDVWAYVRRELNVEDWGRLVAAARASDPDAERNQLRDALERQDPKALERLAAADAAGMWPAATRLLLAQLSRDTPASEQV